MSLGTPEILLFVFISAAAFFAAMLSGRKQLWIGITACFGIAMVVTPADPASMLLVAIPYSLVFTIWTIKTMAPPPGPS